MTIKRKRRKTLHHWELPIRGDYWILVRRDEKDKIHAHLYTSKRAATNGWTFWTQRVTDPNTPKHTTQKRVRMYKCTHWTLEQDWDCEKGIVK